MYACVNHFVDTHKRAVCIVKNLSIDLGAVASSISHDSPLNVLCVVL